MESAIEYHEDRDVVIAFVGVRGREGLFRYSRHQPGGWEYFLPESGTWDFFHQWAFRQLKSRALTPEELPPEVPPLPELTETLVNEARARERAETEPGRDLLEHPLLLAAIRSSPRERLVLQLILREDPYESSFGDGEFHDLHQVRICGDVQTARLRPGDQPYVYARAAVLGLESGRAKVLRMDKELFDTHTPREVLKRLVKVLEEGEGGTEGRT